MNICTVRKQEKNICRLFLKKIKVVKEDFVKIDYAEIICVNDTPKIASPISRELSVPIHKDFKEVLSAIAFHVPFITKMLPPNKYKSLFYNSFLKESQIQTIYEQSEYEPHDMTLIELVSISEVHFNGESIKIIGKTDMEDIFQTREICINSADYVFNPDLSEVIEKLKNEAIQFLYFGKYNRNVALQLKLQI